MPGRYHVELSPDWNCPVVPQGGLMSALAARAMQLELGRTSADGADGLDLRTLTTVYAAQVPAGSATVDVDVLRQGRSMSQLTATVRAEGADAGHTSIAVFGRERAGFSFTDLVMPEVPPPGACPSFRDPPPPEVDAGEGPFPFWERLEGRAASGHAPWEEFTPSASDNSAWYRFDDPPRLADGRLDPLMLISMADTMPSSISERIGTHGTDWYPPSADLTIHLLGQPVSEWILGHKRARHAGDGYASIEMALWDPEVGLVAHACQMMFFVFPDGPPPPGERIPLDQRG